MKKPLSLLLILFMSLSLMAIEINFKKVIRNGIGKSYYKSLKYKKAMATFQKNAIDYPENPALHYNLANAYYQAGDYDSALKEYQIALNNKTFSDADKAHHNVGNIHFQKKDYESAMKSYRSSMIKNPLNTDSRYNYELAKRKLKEEQENKKKQKNNDNQNQDKSKQEQNKPEQNQQQENQEQSQAKMDAQSVLKAIEEQEKEDLKKKRQNAAKYKSGKYW